MHWINDKESTFQKTYENLKVGGKFAIILCAASHVIRVWELLYPNIKESVFFGSSEEFRIIISKCGFEVECNSVKLERYNFESVDKVIEWSIATMNVDPTSIDPHASYR